jgi:copper homeostasis protein
VQQLRAHRRTIVSVPHRTKGSIAVEVAVESVAGARNAAAAGADRLELCSSLGEGGLTPSLGLLAAVRDAVSVPVFAMVRPRAGDFFYDDAEFDVMQRDVKLLREAGAAGIVGGVLTADGRIDEARLAALCRLSAPLPLTCHRAFDLAADAAAALDALVRIGVARVLTSGQARSAPEGAAAIAALVARAAGRIAVMAGAGVRDDNVAAIVAKTGCREVHLSATSWGDSAMKFRRAGVPMATAQPPDEFRRRSTDGAMVARVVAALRGA